MAISDGSSTGASSRSILWGIAAGVAVAVFTAVAFRNLVMGVVLGVATLVVVGALGRARTKRGARVDPFVVGDPWRQQLQAAIGAQRRFLETTKQVRDGALRDYLRRVESQVQAAVTDAHQIAIAGDRIDDTVRRLNSTRLQSDLDRLNGLSNPSEADQTRAASLSTQLESAQRLRERSAALSDDLRVRVTRLGEVVAQASEVEAGTVEPAALESSVDEVVNQLNALRQASEETPAP